MWVPQMMFWKMKTDHLLFFSYASDESFFWLDPKIINVLFSYRKGLLLYTPILTLAFVGFFLLKGKLEKIKFSVLLYFFLNVYVVSCWWCWWYGGGFGMRGLVQSYAVLALPLAAFFEFVFTLNYKKFFVAPLLRFLTVVCFSSFLSLNIIQTYQYSIGMIHWDSMTKEAYWYAFDKFYYVYDDDVKLREFFKTPDYGEALKGNKRD